MKKQELEIASYAGVGPITFGIHSADADALLESSSTAFRKGPNATTEVRAYDELGIHLYYDQEDRLECIEAFQACPLTFRGVALLEKEVETVLVELANLGLACRCDDGYFFDTAGFALYAPDGIVKCVTVYRKGYYD